MNFQPLADNGSFAQQAFWQRRHQRRSMRNGQALAGHAKTSHNGRVEASCPACQEIQRKMHALLSDAQFKEVTA